MDRDGSKSEICERFGETLRQHRLRVGQSQEETAAKAGLDRTYVSSAERGRRNISLVAIVRLARALNVSPSQLLVDLGASSDAQR